MSQSHLNGAAYLIANPDVHAWFDRNVKWEFAISLMSALMKYGKLTDGQLGAVRRCMDRDGERAAVAQAPKATPLFAVKLLESFAAAKASGLKRPTLRIQGLKFSAAPDTGKNPGAIYIKAQADTYLGKLDPNGEFSRGRDLTDEHQAVLDSIGADPLEAAKLHGMKTGECACCGRELSDPKSVELGIGPVCVTKWGWERS